MVVSPHFIVDIYDYELYDAIHIRSDPYPIVRTMLLRMQKKVIIIIKRFFPIVKRIVIASFKIQIRAVPYYSFANVIDDICTYYKYKVCSVYICTVGPYIVRICIVHFFINNTIANPTH